MIFNATIDKVVDGDTIHAIMDLGFKTSCKQVIRLAKVDCPEISTQTGQEARTFTTAWLANNAKGLRITVHGQEKYGRWLGTVGTLNQDLVDLGYTK